MNNGIALKVKELRTFQTASTATNVIPPATKWRSIRPVRPREAPKAKPLPASSDKPPVKITQKDVI